MKKILKIFGGGGLGILIFIILLLFLSGKPNLYPLQSHSKAYYSQDELLHLSLSPDEKYRVLLTKDQISSNLIKTTLLKEDRFFESHFGINPISLIRAFVKTYILKERIEGASTITMQLARLSQGLYTRDVSGKLYQIWQALRLELFYSKVEILEAYLNQAPYGGNIEGIGAASIIYFSKRAQDLTLGESIYLTSIPQNPNARYYYGKNFDRINFQNSRKELINLIESHENKKINQDLILSIWPYQSNIDIPFKTPHLIQYLNQKNINSGEIKTTIDIKVQNLLETKIKQYVNQKNKLGVLNASGMILHYPTMKVKALVGSKDFFDSNIFGQVDGTRAYRSPGSTLKPMIYALGFDQGLIHPQSILKDSPIDFALYSPQNYDQRYQGPISATKALIRSRNIPAIRITQKLKNPSFYDFLKEVEIKKLKDSDFYGLALALGGVEVRMQDLVKMYAMLANQGKWQDLNWIDSEKKSKSFKNMISPESAYMTLDILKANTPPHQILTQSWILNPTSVKWKTGTSHGFRDAWSVGIVGPYVMAIWLGHFDGSANPEFKGLTLAAPLFFEIIDGLKSLEMPMAIESTPKNLSRVKVCSVSGQMPNSYCSKLIKTWFIPGKSPHQTCQIHRQIKINSKTGLRSCESHSLYHESRVYEFWSSDLLELFEKAGLPRKTPPPYEAECRLSQKSKIGKKPEIISPKKRLIYHRRLNQSHPEKIPLESVVDADVKRVYWFLDESYLGSISHDQTLFLDPKPGDYQLRLIDDQGREVQQNLKIKLVQ